jgi:hypothetical protein
MWRCVDLCEPTFLHDLQDLHGATSQKTAFFIVTALKTSNLNTVFFLVSWGGVRLSPLGTSATNWPIVPAPDDR